MTSTHLLAGSLRRFNWPWKSSSRGCPEDCEDEYGDDELALLARRLDDVPRATRVLRLPPPAGTGETLVRPLDVVEEYIVDLLIRTRCYSNARLSTSIKMVQHVYRCSKFRFCFKLWQKRQHEKVYLRLLQEFYRI